MDTTLIDFFVVVIGAALSMAGLASLISLFKNSNPIHGEEIYLLRSIILWSLCVGLGGMLPFAVASSFSEPRTIWGICSVAYVVVGTGLLIQTINQLISKKVTFIYRVSYLLLVFLLVVIVLQVFNVLIWQEVSLYVWGLVGGLTIVAFRLYLMLVAVTQSTIDTPS